MRKKLIATTLTLLLCLTTAGVALACPGPSCDDAGPYIFLGEGNLPKPAIPYERWLCPTCLYEWRLLPADAERETPAYLLLTTDSESIIVPLYEAYP